MAKSIEEEKILSEIYNESNSDRYQLINKECEDPDFKFLDNKKAIKFGVEVTSLYYSQSSYKLRNVINIEKLILEKGITYKDRNNLCIHKFYAKFDNNWVHVFDKIYHKPISYDDYINKIKSIILDKSSKSLNYDKKLAYYELIIFDQENYLSNKDIKKLKYLEDNEELKEIIEKSNFERIYFITIINGFKMLILCGNKTDGPFNISDTECVAHWKYMNDIYNGVYDIGKV